MCVCVYVCVFMLVCVCALCVVLVCMWMRLMDCLCVDSLPFVLTMYACALMCLHAFVHVFVSFVCSTSLSGGNQVDGLSPASSLRTNS